MGSSAYESIVFQISENEKLLFFIVIKWYLPLQSYTSLRKNDGFFRTDEKFDVL